MSDDRCANPILLGWVKEWLDLARERNSKGVTTYRRAYESLKACPLPLAHPSQAVSLKGIGQGLCSRLTENWVKYCRDNGIPLEDPSKGNKRTATDGSESASKRPKTTKPYVPKFRSGPYGIILALSSVDENSTNGLTKNQLIDLAQPHCDTSYTVPQDTRGFYTAWNSMKTLSQKGIVSEHGRPTRRYQLTDEGWEIARGMRGVEAGNRSVSGSAATSRAVSRTTSNQRETSVQSTAAAPPPASGTGTAMASLFGSSHTNRPQKVFNMDDLDNWNAGEVSNLGAEANRAPRENPSPLPPPSRTVTAPMPATSLAGTEFTGRQLSRAPSIAAPRHAPELEEATNARMTGFSSPIIPASPRPLRTAQPRARTIDFETAAPVPEIAANQPSPEECVPIDIPPDSFTVELVLDNREIRTQKDRDYISNELYKKGVSYSVRALELGDTIWAARMKDPHFLAQYGEEGDMIPLDYILERKRLDDLINSIKDGRFHEQKFRLRRSGMRNVIYLVEEYSISDTNQERYMEAVDTSIAFTQVVDECFVKKTRCLDDTIRYMARMTRTLQDMYTGSDGSLPTHRLAFIPTKDITSTVAHLNIVNHLRTRPENEKKTFSPVYDTFATLSSKSDMLTLKDLYLKMLMCVRSLSGDKAIEVQKRWPTPRHFVEAFDQAKIEGEITGRGGPEDMLFAQLGQLVGVKKVGKALSKKVADVWT